MICLYSPKRFRRKLHPYSSFCDMNSPILSVVRERAMTAFNAISVRDKIPKHILEDYCIMSWFLLICPIIIEFYPCYPPNKGFIEIRNFRSRRVITLSSKSTSSIDFRFLPPHLFTLFSLGINFNSKFKNTN